MSDGFDKSEVVVREVEVRPARSDERRRWDALMEEHHYLGFRQFAGRGLRHVAVWRGHWLALVGWQSGAFKCGCWPSGRPHTACDLDSGCTQSSRPGGFTPYLTQPVAIVR